MNNLPDNAKVYVGNFYQSAVSSTAPEYLDVLFYVRHQRRLDLGRQR
ncbi:MAG: hypothetical protein U0P45_02940 [Acidimicrobiales bacterium]